MEGGSSSNTDGKKAFSIPGRIVLQISQIVRRANWENQAFLKCTTNSSAIVNHINNAHSEETLFSSSCWQVNGSCKYSRPETLNISRSRYLRPWFRDAAKRWKLSMQISLIIGPREVSFKEMRMATMFSDMMVINILYLTGWTATSTISSIIPRRIKIGTKIISWMTFGARLENSWLKRQKCFLPDSKENWTAYGSGKRDLEMTNEPLSWGGGDNSDLTII